MIIDNDYYPIYKTLETREFNKLKNARRQPASKFVEVLNSCALDKSNDMRIDALYYCQTLNFDFPIQHDFHVVFSNLQIGRRKKETKV